MARLDFPWRAEGLLGSEPPEIFVAAPEEKAGLGEETDAAGVEDWDTPEGGVRRRRWRTLGRANSFRLDRQRRPLSEVLAFVFEAP